MKDGKYLYSDLDGRVYLRIKDGSYKCLTADTNTGWEEGEKGDVDELIPSMWELIEDPEITDLREQLEKANDRVEELELTIVAITHADETGYVDDVGFVQGWSDVCDETKLLLNKFAIEKKIEGIDYLLKSIAPSIKMGEKCLWRFETYEVESVKDQLRKEQE